MNGMLAAILHPSLIAAGALSPDYAQPNGVVIVILLIILIDYDYEQDYDYEMLGECGDTPVAAIHDWNDEDQSEM
jgi:hypothetical protein